LNNGQFWLFSGFAMLLMPLNWYLESLKWSLVLDQKIIASFYQVLRGLAYSHWGGLIGQILGRSKGFKKKDLIVTTTKFFWIGLYQQIWTFFGGLLGVALYYKTYELLAIVVLLMFLLPLLLPIISTHSLKPVANTSAEDQLKLWLYSGLRYSAYLLQFGLIMVGLTSEFIVGTLLGYAVFLFSKSLFPKIHQLFDLTLRGVLAVGISNYFEGDAQIWFLAVAIIWVVNIVIPSLIGALISNRVSLNPPQPETSNKNQ
jgi:hypothetical protein